MPDQRLRRQRMDDAQWRAACSIAPLGGHADKFIVAASIERT